jgi:hypothetical protein
MSRRAVAWPAWSLCALCVALVALTILLQHLTPEIPRRDLPPLAYVLVGVLWLTYPTVGALVVSHQPRNLIGWIFCAAGIVIIATICLQAYADYVVFALRSQPPGIRYVAWAAQSGFIGIVVVFLTTVLLFLLFPNGRPPSRWWWVVACVAVVGNALVALWVGTWPGPMYDYPAIDNPFGLVGRSRDIVEALGDAGLLIVISSLVASLASVLVRWEKAGAEERQQLWWFTTSAAPVVLVSIVTFWAGGLGVSALLPIAAGIAIFKHRLYSIDVIINRTLVYGSLTVTLVALYLGGIATLQRIFVALTGQESTLAIVTSTLAIAALFGPLRRRIQAFIDRRFYRRKYNAAKTLEAFAATLRDETDLDTLSENLVGVVRETMQPEHVSLWLHPDPALKDKKKRAAIRESGRDEQ